MSRGLIIGDTGLLGQALVARGRLLGLDVRGASRRSPDIALDALQTSALEQTLDAIRPSWVINAAGLIDVNQCEKAPEMAWLANARLPAILASSCAARDIRFLHISTDHYYTGDGATPHPETHPVALVNEYARTKYAGECMVLTYPQTLVIRTNIVGFRGWRGAPTFVEWLLDALEQQTPIGLYTDFYTSSLCATQLAEALFLLLETPAHGILNIASREGSSKLEFATALAQSCGLSIKAAHGASLRSLAGARRADSLVLNTDKAEKILNIQLPDLAAVVRQLAREYNDRNH